MKSQKIMIAVAVLIAVTAGFLAYNYLSAASQTNGRRTNAIRPYRNTRDTGSCDDYQRHAYKRAAV